MAQERRLCADYAKMDRLQRGRQEFESVNARRLVQRRQGAGKSGGGDKTFKPWYYTCTVYNNRIPHNNVFLTAFTQLLLHDGQQHFLPPSADQRGHGVGSERLPGQCH